jgi:hypothetical protein
VDYNTVKIGEIWTTISYPLRLNFTPTFRYIKLFETTAACQGSYENPTAEPGELCVYERGTNDISATPLFCNGLFSPDSTSGCGLEFEVKKEGEVARASGSWAVTAP